MTLDPASNARARLLNAVRLHVNGARTDVVMAEFAACGVDPCGNPEHLRAVAQLAVCLRMREEPSEAALALLIGVTA